MENKKSSQVIRAVEPRREEMTGGFTKVGAHSDLEQRQNKRRWGQSALEQQQQQQQQQEKEEEDPIPLRDE